MGSRVLECLFVFDASDSATPNLANAMQLKSCAAKSQLNEFCNYHIGYMIYNIRSKRMREEGATGQQLQDSSFLKAYEK